MSEPTPPPIPPRNGMSLGTAVFLVILAIFTATGGLIAYIHFSNQPDTYRNCWTDACRERVAKRAMENLRHSW